MKVCHSKTNMCATLQWVSYDAAMAVGSRQLSQFGSQTQHDCTPTILHLKLNDNKNKYTSLPKSQQNKV